MKYKWNKNTMCRWKKRWLFEQNYKNQYILAKLTKERKKWIQINKICDGREGRTLQQTIKNSMDH